MPTLITEPEIHRTEAVRTARIRLHIPRTDVGTLLPPALEELYTALAAQHIAPAGPWFAHHIELPETHFHFDACVPITPNPDQPLEPTGRVLPGRLPAMPVARALYRGPYTQLAAAWAELRAWLAPHIASNDLRPAPELIERYLRNPVDTQDPNALETELVWPLLPPTATTL